MLQNLAQCEDRWVRRRAAAAVRVRACCVWTLLRARARCHGLLSSYRRLQFLRDKADAVNGAYIVAQQATLKFSTLKEDDPDVGPLLTPAGRDICSMMHGAGLYIEVQGSRGVFGSWGGA